MRWLLLAPIPLWWLLLLRWLRWLLLLALAAAAGGQDAAIEASAALDVASALEASCSRDDALGTTCKFCLPPSPARSTPRQSHMGGGSSCCTADADTSRGSLHYMTRYIVRSVTRRRSVARGFPAPAAAAPAAAAPTTSAAAGASFAAAKSFADVVAGAPACHAADAAVVDVVAGSPECLGFSVAL